MKPIEQTKKWVRRGVQPEVAPAEPIRTVAIAKLARDIRECSDPQRKAELEAQFQAECAAYDAIIEDAHIVDVSKTYQEFTETLGACGVVPAEIDKETWSDYHQKLLRCKQLSARWLRTSRKFAIDRWGDKWVEQAEQQMELALGIDHHSKPCEPKRIECTTIATAINKHIARFLDVVQAKPAEQWTDDDAKHCETIAAKAERFAMQLRNEIAKWREAS